MTSPSRISEFSARNQSENLPKKIARTSDAADQEPNSDPVDMTSRISGAASEQRND